MGSPRAYPMQADIADEDMDEQETRCLTLRIEGRTPSELVTASIYPVVMEPTYVIGQFVWDDMNGMSSLVRVDLAAGIWGRWLLLVWAAAGDECVRVVPVLGAGQWKCAKLVLPDLDGQSEDTVTVQIDSKTWSASLSATSANRQAVQRPIPQTLHGTEVGRVLAKMSSVLLSESGRKSHTTHSA